MDYSKVGQEAAPFTMPADWSKIREFANATLNDDPIYFDPEYAEKTRFGGVPTPPTWVVDMLFWATPETHLDLGLVDSTQGKGGYLLHGETEWIYLKPIMAGDTLTVKTKVADMYEKQGRRGGKMEFAVTEHTFINQHGEECVRYLSTVIQQWVTPPTS
ncbi:MAG: MaoC family dehydratase N-terminal domain-containing protein [Dehalococcoidia bacterium]|jgi:acyl dehydratase